MLLLLEENDLGHLVYVRNKKTLPHQAGWWNEKKKLEVITTWLATGNLAETARLCNVPRETLVKWKQAEWWQKNIDEIQSGDGQKADVKMSKVIDKALDMLMTRIEEGDYQYDQKTGRLVKIPLKARDLERVAAGLFDKRQLIRKQPTTIKASDLNQSERLLQLAEQFAKFAGQKVAEEKVINEYLEGDFDEIRNDLLENNDGLQIKGQTPSEEVINNDSTD